MTNRFIRTFMLALSVPVGLISGEWGYAGDPDHEYRGQKLGIELPASAERLLLVKSRGGAR
ncbi:MAG: hypothetical protein ACE5NW_13810 [Acidiferrobacterales bacterium]